MEISGALVVGARSIIPHYERFVNRQFIQRRPAQFVNAEAKLDGDIYISDLLSGWSNP